MKLNNITKEFLRQLNEIGVDTVKLYEIYSQSWRHYHTIEHLFNMYEYLYNISHGTPSIELTVAIAYHDFEYLPTSNTNEEDSVKYFLEDAKHLNLSSEQTDYICKLIMCTKNHKPFDFLSQMFINADMNILASDIDKLIDYEHKIFREYQIYPLKIYKEHRINFLEANSNQYPNLLKLAEYVRTRQYRVAVYPGSFNPFHAGHLNILRKAEQVFDKVIILVGANHVKNVNPLLTELPETILNTNKVRYFENMLFEHIEEVKILEGCDDITVVKGLRNGSDFENEQTQQFYNNILDSKLKSVYFICDQEFTKISSSSLRFVSEYEQFKKYLIK